VLAPVLVVVGLVLLILLAPIVLSVYLVLRLLRAIRGGPTQIHGEAQPEAEVDSAAEEDELLRAAAELGIDLSPGSLRARRRERLQSRSRGAANETRLRRARASQRVPRPRARR